jgi:hypothetical protein
MRWPWRRRPEMSNAELLDGLRALARNITVQHNHVVKHEPIPAPSSGSVVIKRLDGSDAWRGYIHCGRGALTMLDVPLANLDSRFSPAEAFRFEFRWER